MAEAGVGQTFGQSAPAIDTRIRWPAPNRQPVASTWIVSGTTAPGSIGCGSVRDDRRVPLSMPLATRCDLPSEVDVRDADRHAEDVDVGGHEEVRPGAPEDRQRRVERPTRIGQGQGLVRALVGGQPELHAARPQPVGDPDGRIDEEAVGTGIGGIRAGRVVGQASVGPEVEAALRGARRRPGRFGAPRPALSSRPGASEPVSCMNTAIAGSSISPSSRPRHQ